MTDIVPKLAVERCRMIAALGPVPPWWRFRARRRWIESFQGIMRLDISRFGEMMRAAYSPKTISDLANRPSLSFAKVARAADRNGQWIVPVDYSKRSDNA